MLGRPRPLEEVGGVTDLESDDAGLTAADRSLREVTGAGGGGEGGAAAGGT